MKPLVRVTSPILPLMEDRIDTDIIFPARFLLLMQREGLRDCLFRDRRFTATGESIPGSVFDDTRRTGAQILLAGEDFGTGSSREQAVWALADYGIQCVIAVSFGEIFAANAVRNGMLALPLPRADIERIAAVESATVDIEAQEIICSGFTIPVRIPSATRQRLLSGLDEIDTILSNDREGIKAFEADQRRLQPWLYEDVT